MKIKNDEVSENNEDISDNCNNFNYDDVNKGVENVVSKNDMVNSGGNESRELVEVRGVLVREYEEWICLLYTSRCV